jgi:hypothetical protein
VGTVIAAGSLLERTEVTLNWNIVLRGGRCQGQDRRDQLLVWIRLLLGLLDPRLQTPVCPADLSVIGVGVAIVW